MSPEKEPPKLDSVALVDAQGAPVSIIKTGQKLVMRLEYHVPPRWTKPINCGFAIWRSDNVLIAAASSGHDGVDVPCTPGARHRALITVPRIDLNDGEFTVIGYLYDENCLHIYDHRMNELPLVIQPQQGHVGVISLNHEWRFETPR